MATEAASEQPNLLGQKLFGTYTITDKLGEGAMGSVYLAKQGQTGQRIAIKLLNEEAQRDHETVQRFLREARVISMLNHPNVVRVFIFGETSTSISYMAMEYVDGIPLENIVRREPLDQDRVLDISRQMLGAIGEAHDLGIMHRDLKPENVLLTEHRGRRDFVKILDFGIAKVQNANQQLTQSGVVYGTPAYMSPEQAQALDIDARADLYSLGCMMYEMVTGRLPFDAKTALKILEMQAFREPKPPSEIVDVDGRLEAIILKAMAKAPENRYQTAQEMLEALDALEKPAVPANRSEPQSADIPVSFRSLNRLAEAKAWFWPAVFGVIGVLSLLCLILFIALVVS
jgi:serine/threonine-protein kinase